MNMLNFSAFSFLTHLSEKGCFMSSFCKLSLVLSSVALAVVGCKKSSGGSDSASSSNDAQASSQGTTPAAATTQD